MTLHQLGAMKVSEASVRLLSFFARHAGLQLNDDDLEYLIVHEKEKTVRQAVDNICKPLIYKGENSHFSAAKVTI